MKKRPELKEIFLRVAQLMALRSTCSSVTAVGAVLATPDGRLVASGYNGSPSGLPHCDDVGCDDDGHYHRVIHAEENAIIQCARCGVSTIGLSLYCTHFPCERCAARLVQAGVRRVFYLEPQANPEKAARSEAILKKAEVYVCKVIL